MDKMEMIFTAVGILKPRLLRDVTPFLNGFVDIMAAVMMM